MGRDNRQRRAAKARARARARAGARTGGTGPPPWARPSSQAADADVETALVTAVARLWARGWQPAELHRQARRTCSTAPAARLVHHVMAVDHANRRAADLDNRWIEQVSSLHLPPTDGRPGWLRTWAEGDGLDEPTARLAVLEVLMLIDALRPLDALMPPPGHVGPWTSPVADWGGAATDGGRADPVLERVRRLLAKAESTTFEAEAMAFTAKAQELMTRHAIDEALLGSHAPGTARPVMVRIPVDAPYADAKSLLLQEVARHGRCKAVMMGGLDMSSVVGFPADVAAVELLFTSLLVQAQTSMAAAAAGAPAGARTRRASYRSAFLLSYANRISDRLAEVNAAVVSQAEAAAGRSLLPALRSREEEVEAVVTERFGELRTSAVRRAYDAAGWAHGRHAADNAHLTAGDLPAHG